MSSIASKTPGTSDTPDTPESMSDARAMPQPCREERDSDSRLVAVTFESGRLPAPPPAGACWLVALDGSGQALQALTQAMRLALESSVPALDLVNVQPWLSKEAAEIHLPQRGWAQAAAACAILDANGLGWRLHVRMGEPAASIVLQAEALGSRGIVIGARGLSSTENLLLGSVAQQVIHAAQGAVLVVRTPAGLPPGTQDRSLAAACS